MAKEMLINVSQGEECRIALVEDGKLEELYMERTSSTSHVGNIYKGRVSNVEPSIQAAFIDFGMARNGFLHISDLMPTYFGRNGADVQETVGRKMARRDRPPIQRCLRRGDEIIVQIIKEGIGTKGPTLSTYLSIPGRILVMMPGMGKMGVSRKIEDDLERRRLRQILDALKPPKDVGFIIRTAGIGKSKTEIQRDLTYLTRLWTILVKKRDSGPGPTELYTEGDLVTRTVRDVFTTDVDRVVVDDKEVAKRVKEVIKLANPRAKNKVELFEEPVPLFHKYGIEKEIEQMYSRHVPLPSGGSLVIDSTEAVVAIDVNSGKFRDHADAETTAFKTDMEAADEIPRQLRLRDLGGVIICDFIDLRYERHRRDLGAKLHANFQKDRAKTKVLPMSQFGIIEITRQRMRPSLKRSIYCDCPYCKGAGLVKTPESMSLDVMRRLAIAAHNAQVARVELTIAPDVNFFLQNRKRAQIAELEAESGKKIIIRADAAVGLDEVRMALFDLRDSAIYLAELGMSPPLPPSVGGREPRQRGPQRGRRDGRQRNDGRRPPLPPRHQEPEDDAFDLDAVEDEVDQREEEQDQDMETPPSEVSMPAVLESNSPEAELDESVAEPGELAMDTSGSTVGPPAEQGDRGDFDNGQPGGPRRRRRRGRRGRGRGRGRDQGGDQQQPPPPMQPVNAPFEGYDQEIEEFDRSDEGEPAVEPPEPGNEALPTEAPPPREGGRRRRRRGGRGRGRGRNQNGAPISPAEQGQQSAPVPPPPPLAPRAAEATRHTPTGSTDKHLVSDEPIGPQPIHRPRSYRDLDSIPDDFD